MALDSTRWARVKAWFEQLSEAPAAQRQQALATEPDTQVAAEVWALLQRHDAPDHFLTQPVAPPPPGPAPAGVADGGQAGQRLGAWCLVSPLGQGGMGEVWRAARADGAFSGEAAIKLLRAGLGTASVLARFAQEQQALARLNHPHIARLFDAGLSGDGRPYFVMELVEGQTLDRAARGLPLPARLQLCLQLADAVAHAHRNLLVHRDLKPGNVLVNADGQVKLLDFGIAQALGAEAAPPSTSPSTPTPAGGGPAAPPLLAYTPHYASPEQVRGEPVSTATDIYSLGVLMYQVLTGARPTGRTATTAAEAARSVLEETPVRPSGLGPELVDDPAWLRTRRHLQGDLDHILLKALEKDPAQRYRSVDALADDLRRHLAGLPVSARTPTAGYVLQKFAGRHRGVVLASALALLALVGGLAATAWAQRQTELQRQAAERRFEQVRGLANRLLFDYYDDIHLLPGSTAVLARMLKEARSTLESLASEARGQPALQRELGVAYRRLGELHHAESRPALGDVNSSLVLINAGVAQLEAAAQAEPASEPTRYQLALTLVAQARSLRNQGRPREALAPLERSAALFGALTAQFPADKSYRIEQVRAQLRLAEVFGAGSTAELAQRERAAEHLRQAEALVGPLRTALPDDADALALFATVHNLRWLNEFGAGQVEAGLQRLRGLTPVFQRLLQLRPDNALHQRDAAVNFLSQGTALMRLQRWPEALQASSEALRRMQALAQADPESRTTRRDLAKLQTDVAWAHFKLGHRSQAAEGLDLAITTLQPLASHDPNDRRLARLLATAQAQRAEVAAAAGDAAAVAHWSSLAVQGLQQQLKATPDDHTARVALATVLTQRGAAWAALPREAARACAAYGEALVLWQALDAAGRLRPAEAPRRDQAHAGAAACGGMLKARR